MDWDEVAEHVKAGGMASLATASPEGRPHVAVVSPAVEGPVIWFGTNTASGKVRNLRSNPQVALMWRPQAEIYLWGTAQLISAPDDKRRVWEAGLFGYDQAALFGSPDNPNMLFVRVEPVSATVLSVGGGGLTRRTWHRP